MTATSSAEGALNETVLVTGGNGSIGSWVCRELAARDVEVVVLDLLPEPRVDLPDAGRPTVVVGDIRDPEVLREVFGAHRISSVVHLAALVFTPCETDPVLAFDVNATGTARLLEVAEGAGVRRFVANSTKGTLGPLPDRYLHPTYEPVPIDHPPSPQSIYETSKFAVERLLVGARARGLSAASFRLSTTWGPGKSGATHGGLGFHSDVVNAAAHGESSRVDIHADQGFDLVYYGDVAAAIADACLTPGTLHHPVYHVGSGRIVTMAEFAAAVEGEFEGVSVTLGDTFPAGRYCRLDIAPLERDAGYRPRFDLAVAMADARRILAAPVTPARVP